MKYFLGVVYLLIAFQYFGQDVILFFQITDRYNLSLIAGLGLKNKNDGIVDEFEESFSDPHAFLEGNIGIRF